MSIKFTPNQTLTCARPGETIALGGEALPLPRPGLRLELFVYKRSSSFMSYNREKQRSRRGWMLPVCCFLGWILAGLGFSQ